MKSKPFNLPVNYDLINQRSRKRVREQYIELQAGKCYWCQALLSGPPAFAVQAKYVDLGLFPPGFLERPVHLQHNHVTGMTEGAVHSRCNAVMWQYHNR